ncbi:MULTISPECIES: MFS transporter [Rhizobium]|uniref:Membrane protein n=1 Tax=Rhizobium favelukesii TaxID=348824 RepID=W6RGN3_9HYPH|nr:MFS transporter [Rhizobium favelukesii]CDM60372.1 putative membrane protein [Rhizobium favelukesii]
MFAVTTEQSAARPGSMASIGRIAQAEWLRTFLSPLRVGSFRLYVCANFFQLVSSWSQRFALLWIVWESSHSMRMLSFVPIGEMAPTIWLGYIAGIVADKTNRFHIVIGVQRCLAVVAFLLSTVAASAMGPTPAIILWCLNGTLIAFLTPAAFSLTPMMVGRELLPKAIAINSVCYSIAVFVAPVLVYVLIEAIGPWIVFSLNGIMLIIYSTVISKISQNFQSDAGVKSVGGQRRAWSPQVTAPIVGTLASLAIVCMLFRPIGELLPGIVASLHGTTDLALIATLTSAFTLGGLFSSLILLGWISPSNASRINGPVALGLSVSAIAMIWAESNAILTLIMFAFGLTLAMNATLALVLVQLEADEQSRGKLVSIYFYVYSGGTALGSVLYGIGEAFPRSIIVFASIVFTVFSACRFVGERRRKLWGNRL